MGYIMKERERKREREREREKERERESERGNTCLSNLFNLPIVVIVPI